MTNSHNALKISSARLGAFRLDFIMDIAHSLASRSSTENVFVVVESESGMKGYGECVPRAYVTGETPESVIESLRHLIPVLTGEYFTTPDGVVEALENLSISPVGSENPAALCAAELAILDLAGKHWNKSVSEILGFTISSEPLFYSLVVPFLRGKALEKFLEHAAPFDFRHVKVKVSAENPADHVRRIKSLLGSGPEIRVDANCSWSLENAPGFMREMADLDVASIEQPLPPYDFESMASIRTPGVPLITLDESVKTISDVEHVAAAGACDVVNIRISKCGGILGAVRVAEAARKHGLEVQLGAHVGESCVLSAAGVHLASGTRSFRWLEGCFGKHLLRDDLCEEDFRFGFEGRVFPLKGPGFGIAVSEERLKAATVSCEEVR